MTFITACLQLSCQDNIKDNVTSITNLLTDAKKDGAVFVVTPENSLLMASSKDELYKNAEYMESNPHLNKLQNEAAKLGIWLLIGSIATKIRNSKKLVNRSILIDNNGEIRSFYDKIHLFDVDLEGESHRESERFDAGEYATITSLPWCNLGMTICYDVRFPEQYKMLALAGAEVITVPAAFTEVTGKAHWHILLQARAIETGCYIVAPAQCGTHPANRKTFGHSLIINPWGKILADAGDRQGFIIAEINPHMSDKVRQQLPNLKHGRDIKVK